MSFPRDDNNIMVCIGASGTGKTYSMSQQDPFSLGGVSGGPIGGTGTGHFGNGGQVDPGVPDDYDDEPPAAVIKSVFCSYRGILVVHDVHGIRVDELCGEITMDKYREIERRSRVDITEFDGLEHYRCIVCDLEKKDKERERKIMNGDPDVIGTDGNDYNPFDIPIKSSEQFVSPAQGDFSNFGDSEITADADELDERPDPAPMKQSPITPVMFQKGNHNVVAFGYTITLMNRITGESMVVTSPFDIGSVTQQTIEQFIDLLPTLP